METIIIMNMHTIMYVEENTKIKHVRILRQLSILNHLNNSVDIRKNDSFLKHKL